MKAKMISWLVSTLITALPKSLAKTAIDKMLDVIEDAVADSATKVDDAMVLPVCKWIREALDVPDND